MLKRSKEDSWVSCLTLASWDIAVFPCFILQPLKLWQTGNPLQCSCLEKPRDGGAWWAAVYGVAQSRARLKWLSSSSSSGGSYKWLLPMEVESTSVQWNAVICCHIGSPFYIIFKFISEFLLVLCVYSLWVYCNIGSLTNKLNIICDIYFVCVWKAWFSLKNIL